MREAGALIRAAWLTAASYRLQMLFQILGLFVVILPLYFISGALQPIMADSIRLEGGEYFAFVIVGIVTYMMMANCVTGLHGALSGQISSGALEAMLATPTPISSILMGEMGYGFFWSALRGTVLLAGAWAFGAQILWARALPAMVIILLIMLAYLPFGILAGAAVLAFRTTGPLPTVILWLSGTLGGVYYPTSVVPSWLASVSAWLPLTYGLRSLRRCLIEGAPLAAQATDLSLLIVSTVALMAVSMMSFAWALRYAKRAGTLAQY